VSITNQEATDRIGKVLDDYMAERARVLERDGRFRFDDEVLKEACTTIEIAGASVGVPNEDYTPPDPHEKARKNYIDGEVLKMIEDDLCYSPEIAEYIDEQAKFDAQFPERLRSNFLKIYDECLTHEDGKMGNEVFMEILCRLTKRTKDFRLKSAVEVLLVHYFAFCEVFPKDGPGTTEVFRRKA